MSPSQSDKRLTPEQVQDLARVLHDIEIKAGGSRLMAGDLANVNAAVKGVADAKRQFFDVPGAHSGVLASTKTKDAKR